MKKWIEDLQWKKWREAARTGWERCGFAVVMLLCAVVIGIGMFLGERAADPKAAEVADAVPTPAATLRPVEPVRAAQVEPVAVSIPEPTEAPLSLPLLGGKGETYASDSLVYSQTLGEWTTHEGIDLLAPEGTEVGAAADGTVLEAYEDASWGNVVIIDHGGGFITGYASLGEIAVAAGESVSRGQCVGTAGASAMVESQTGAHVHFFVLSDGRTVDPRTYLR